MVTKTFNKLDDDIKITATILRSKEHNNLTLETSNNLIITSNNLTLSGDDLSVNKIYLGEASQNLKDYIDGKLDNIQGIQLYGDASLSNLDISENLNVQSIKFNNGLEISANYIPTTYSTYKFKINTDLPSVLITDSSGDQWVQDPSYTITTNPFKSQKSAIKIDFKINYICSQEAEQYISFRVLRNAAGNSDGSLVFQDISLGNAMGVTDRNIYYGNYIDVPDSQWSGNQNIYYLEFKVSKGSDQSLDLSSGIYGYDHDYYNYMSVQELYIPLNY